MTESDLAAFEPWLKRRESRIERLAQAPAAGLAAMLDLSYAPGEGEALPPLWHGLYFLDQTPSVGLGPDGSPLDHPMMPPVPLPQVMWAGAEYHFHAPLRVGDTVQRHSRIAAMTLRQGARGPMVFVDFEHRLERDGQPLLDEINRAVFLGPASGGAAAPTPATTGAAVAEQQWPVDEARLFRYSALTYNAHRIHYDLAYATQEAGQPGLVVHGPLQALWIAETWRRQHPGVRLVRAEFRARASLYLGSPVTVRAAAPVTGLHTLWTCSATRGVAMQGRLQAGS